MPDPKKTTTKPKEEELEDQEESEEDLNAQLKELEDIKKLPPRKQYERLMEIKFHGYGYERRKQHKTPTLEEIKERARPKPKTPLKITTDIRAISEELAGKIKAQKMQFGEATEYMGWGVTFVDTCVFNNGGETELHDLVHKNLYGLDIFSAKEHASNYIEYMNYIEKVDRIFIRLNSACKAYIAEGRENGKSDEELRERLMSIITEKGVDLFVFAQNSLNDDDIKEPFLNLLKGQIPYSPLLDRDLLSRYDEATIRKFWSSFGSQDGDKGIARKRGFNRLEPAMKVAEVETYLKKKKFGDAFSLYSCCLEIPVSEKRFRQDLRNENDKSFSIPQEQRQPYIDLAGTHAFDTLDVDTSFSERNYNTLIQQMCVEMLKHVTDPDIGTKLINTAANFTAFSTTWEETIPSIRSLTILPVQRTPRYKSLLEAVIKEAKKLNEKAQQKGEEKPIFPDTITKLEKTLEQVAQFSTIVNESIRLQENGHPLKKEEIEALLLLTRLNILIDESQKAKAQAALPKIANIIITGKPGEIAAALKESGFVINDETKVQDIKLALSDKRKQEIRGMFSANIAKSLIKNSIIPGFLPKNPAQAAKEIENAIRNESPKIVIEKLKKFGFGEVSLVQVKAIKQDLYYSQINSSISAAIIGDGSTRPEIHAKDVGIEMKFTRYSKGYASTTLYIIDKMNHDFEKNDFDKMGKRLQQLGLTYEQITKTMENILAEKKPLAVKKEDQAALATLEKLIKERKEPKTPEDDDPYTLHIMK